MSDTSTELNGSGPETGTAEAEPCTDCVTGGERLLAVVAGIIAIGALVLAIDMFTGGKVFGFVTAGSE